MVLARLLARSSHDNIQDYRDAQSTRNKGIFLEDDPMEGLQWQRPHLPNIVLFFIASSVTDLDNG